MPELSAAPHVAIASSRAAPGPVQIRKLVTCLAIPCFRKRSGNGAATGLAYMRLAKWSILPDQSRVICESREAELSHSKQGAAAQQFATVFDRLCAITMSDFG
jgi:hypothetical protein